MGRYGWGEEEVSTFMFYYRVGCWAGLWLLVPLLTRLGSLGDNVIATIASITTAAGQTCRTCLTKPLPSSE